MLPENILFEIPTPSAFLEPDGRERNPLEDFEQGGEAIGDASKGLRHQPWRAWWFFGVVYIAPISGGTPTALLSLDAVSELSLAFDQNMRPCIAYVSDGQPGLWWFDATEGEHVHLLLPGVASPFVTLDDKRAEFVASSDILLFYLRDGGVWCRQQRERFTVERRLADMPIGTQSIVRCGMGENNRMQLEIT